MIETEAISLSKTGLYINGEWVDSASGGRIESVDPATGEVWVSVAEAMNHYAEFKTTMVNLSTEVEDPWKS